MTAINLTAPGEQNGQPGPESAHPRDEGPPRPRRQQDREDPGPAAAARRRDCQGTAESHRLAAAFPARVPVRYGG